MEKAAVSLVSGAKAAGISVGADRGEQRIQCTSHSGWMGYFQAYLRFSDRIGQQVIQLGSGMLYVNVTRYRFKRLVTFALSFFKPGIEFFIKDNFAFLYLVLSQVDYLGVFGRLVD